MGAARGNRGLAVGLAAGLALGLVMMAGGYFFLSGRQQPPAPAVAVVEQPPPPSAPAVAPAPPKVEAAPAAPVEEQPAEVASPTEAQPPAPAGPEAAEEPATVSTRKAATGRTLRPLTESDIRRVVQSRFSALQACFESHREELPAGRGVVNVFFTILRSGKVTEPEVEGPLEKTQVGQCLRRQFARFRFREHTDDLRLGVPVDYTVHQAP